MAPSGMHAGRAGESSPTCKPIADSKPEMTGVFYLSNPTSVMNSLYPVSPHLLNLWNRITRCAPSLLTCEPMGDVLIQTTSTTTWHCPSRKYVLKNWSILRVTRGVHLSFPSCLHVSSITVFSQIESDFQIEDRDETESGLGTQSFTG